MLDMPPDSTGEKEMVEVQVGDTILFDPKKKPERANQFFLVSSKNEWGSIEALALPTEENPKYGIPGTERADEVLEVTGHFTFDELLHALVSPWFPNNPPQGFVDSMAELLRKHYPREDIS